MASINCSGHGDLQELSGIHRVSRRQTPPRVSLRREVDSSPCALLWGGSPSAPSLRCPEASRSTFRGKRPQKPASRSGITPQRRRKQGGFAANSNNAVGGFGDRCAEREAIPACSCQRLVSAPRHLCVRQLRGSWVPHSSQQHGPGPQAGFCFPGKVSWSGSLHHILFPGFSSASGSPLSLPLPRGPSQHFLQFMTPGSMEVRS